MCVSRRFIAIFKTSVNLLTKSTNWRVLASRLARGAGAMTRQSDTLFVKAALELAALGRNSCAPNPPVGCIIVRDGQIGRGYHRVAGHGHAEVNAIADAGGDIAGATVFVSLEP